MKLWVDDERDAPEGWEHAKTYGEAVAAIEHALTERTLEAISFDHDLGDPDDRCNGYALACLVERYAAEGLMFWFTGQLTCHSDNGPGRKNIELALASVRRILGHEP